ncbi:MAG: phenylalanine--tRNA ligase subunit alpha [Acidobacteria bacterium]|nr:phenylalanine--tRNA ligase subunit alpha [Acidobacteriota bacterium]
MEKERQELVSKGAANEAERDKLCKALRDRWLARKNGIISSIDENWLKKAVKEIKPVVGRHFNELRKLSTDLDTEALIAAVSLVKGRIVEASASFVDSSAVSAQATVTREAPRDLTLPGYRRPLGSIHPVTRVMREIEEIFMGLGFTIELGPEVETVYYNFDALNIPETHPARDDWDTLYVDSDTVLRTHTSPVQIRAMEKRGAPLYIIVPGKVYRHDNPDASHATMFHQIEGLAVDTDITFADLKGTLDFFVKKFFGEKVRTSFQPSFFPFTEPSADMAVSCWVCGGEGCRVCKQSGWVEIMGCGMVHPQVLENCGVDPRKYSGWAFGFGADRMAMIKYGVTDIQLFFQSDVRFLEQF